MSNNITMDNRKSHLVVCISNVEFQNAYNYYLTFQLGINGEKKRTDVSVCVSNPTFQINVIDLPLINFKIDMQQKLIVGAYIVTDRNETSSAQELELKGQSRLLGDCVIPLGQYTHALTDISGDGVNLNQKFQRQYNGKEVNVGRFTTQLKLVGDQKLPNKQDSAIFIPLNNINFFFNIKVDVRSAIDVPIPQKSKLPSAFVELGWCLYEGQKPDDLNMKVSQIIPQDRHPVWNEQFNVEKPSVINKKEGYLYVCLRDKSNAQYKQDIYVPIESMDPFIPYNLEFKLNGNSIEVTRLFISFVLEMKDENSFQDKLGTLQIKQIGFDPKPQTQKYFLILTTNNYLPTELSFVPVDLQSPKNLAQVLKEFFHPNQRMFISQILSITENIYEKQQFTIPVSLMKQQLQFILVGKNTAQASTTGLPNCVVGNTEIIDSAVQNSLFQEQKDLALINLKWIQNSPLFKVFSQSKCNIQFQVQSKNESIQLNDGKSKVDDRFINESNYEMQDSKDSIVQRYADQSYNQDIDISNVPGNDKQKWQVLSRELSQKQEIIHRMLKEIDDKTESLKLTGSEIVDLRRQIKLLQSENTILRKRVADEEQIEISSLVTKEISRMSIEELKAKIIKIAQAYRDERVRNEEFEKALKNAHKDISQSRQLQIELEKMQKDHYENASKLLKLQKDIQKTQLYKDTITKQEKVIAKLEQLMEQTLKDTQKARDAQVELEQIKTENIKLQKNLKQTAYGQDEENSDLQRYKNECKKLERIIGELKEELLSKRPVTSHGEDLQKDKMELEVLLQKSNARVEALQNEMTSSAKKFAREISSLKMIIAEKQAVLESLTMDL